MKLVWNMLRKTAMEARNILRMALAALAVLLAVGLADIRLAHAQGGALPPDVSAAIEAAIQAGEAAAANAAKGASAPSAATRAEIVDRARSRAVETGLSQVVTGGIARHPASVSAIVRAAVRRAPAHRDAIVYRASLSYPAFAREIAAAAGVPQAPRLPAIAPEFASRVAPGESVASTVARAEIVGRTRSQVDELEVAAAVVGDIARQPAAVSAIVRAAVRRAPAHRDAIVYRATISFPAFAPQIAAAAGVSLAPPAPVYAPRVAAALVVQQVWPAVPAHAPPREVAELESRGPPGRAGGRGPPSRRGGGSIANLARDVPRLRIVHTDQSPIIDGVLDEAIWRRAAVIANLTQVEPVEGVPPTERTEVRFLYDSSFLYIGVRSFDSEPDKIIATEMARDAEFESDDHIVIILDTFHDRRNAYLFRVNPLGTRNDGLIENSRRLKGDEWDGIWYAKSSIDSLGWVAEIAIPYKTLSFNPSGTTWGFNIERRVRRKNETSRWAAADQDRGLFDIGDAGVLEGFADLEQGIGLDVKPSVTATYLGDWLDSSSSSKLKPSLDVFYKVTPALTAALTINTDFAETEADEREINLTRFDLFFPEKRDFFLQDKGIFEFGGLERNGIPFFSRRIGLDAEDELVDIIAGGKLTGRVGNLNLGILDIQTDSKGEVDSKNLFVGRASVNVLDQSSVGVILTNGDPRSNGDNTVVGADFNYRSTEVFGDQTLAGNLWTQRSFTDEEKKGGKKDDKGDGEAAYGASLEFQSDTIELSGSFTGIQGKFNPALGFANRRGIKEYVADGRYRHRFRRGGLLRKADVGFSVEIVTGYESHDIESRKINFDVAKLENDIGDKFEFGYSIEREFLDEEFKVFRRDGLIVPAGTFDFDRYKLAVKASDARPLSGSFEVSWGEFFTGDRTEIKPKVTWRPSSFLFLAVEYVINNIVLPSGEFTAHRFRGELVFQFNPDVSLSTLVQYDNVTDGMGINSRFRWIFDPGNEMFIVFNQSFGGEDADTLEPVLTEIASKVVWTFRL